MLQKKAKTGNCEEFILMKKYIVLGGVNGAGKSTLYQILDNLKKMPRVNTDEIVKELGDWRNTSDVLKAGKNSSSVD